MFELNQCICENGIASIGDSCPVNKSNKCDSIIQDFMKN